MSSGRRHAALLFAVVAACTFESGAEEPLFELLSPDATGIGFTNTLPESPEFNILNYLYYYNGGGVAVGDVDGDGLVDLYFSSNLESNRLYRNLGNYRFEDITTSAGVAGPEGWKTGVTMADVNGDGHIDIHVSAVNHLTMHGRNVLYINKGDATFTDRTQEYGLEYAGFSTQAAFFDYDLDGDLDLYLLTHATHNERAIGEPGMRQVRHKAAGDRLLRNEGGRFEDVSEAAGTHGGVDFGLGVVASDLNLDGCPDLYVANDFQENDFLYINNCDGTFRESITRATGHTSRFSMGVDAADVTNDGLPDIVVADMLPEREEILKTSASTESPNLFDLRLRAGYHPQYARNTLQLNRGNGRFSEIGFLAGVHATDWSWAPLFADLDNDGHKDLFVTNGIYRRPNDLDYINYIGNDAVQKSLARGITASNLAILDRLPRVPLTNYAFRNNGDLTFVSSAQAWGITEPGFANGAAYADLNNSGALDLVVNRVNAPAAIYRNHVRERNGHAYLTVQLRGAGANTAGIGTRVLVRHGPTNQMLEQSPTRGFQSSVDPRLHFGLGAATVLDSLTVIWPDRRFQILTSVAVNQSITLRQTDASGQHHYASPDTSTFLRDVTRASGVAVHHAENPFLDYDREPLMPHRLSTEGPGLAVGDVDRDGLDDLYAGGAKWQAGTLLVQRRDGTFHRSGQPAFARDSLHEDVDAAFFDADGDGDADLYVVSGGNEFSGDAEALRDRLYLNDGGTFRRDTTALPPAFENGSSVVPGDFDADGDIDLFVGSRVVARAYGKTPRSRLLQNDRGRFTDVTNHLAPQLAEAGMVSAAAWIDLDADRRLELIVVGEWMPIRVFRQEGGRFVDRTAESGLAGSEGWWNNVTAADLNGDGRPDLVLGNLGLNSYLRASSAEPARLYVHDFGGNGTIEQVLTFYKGGVSYPLAGRDDLFRLMPWLRTRYPTYRDFGASRVEEIFTAPELREAKVLVARTLASSVALNAGNGRFTLHALPVEAQLSSVYTAVAEDFDGDGCIDLLLGGNFYGVPPVIGRYDASPAVLLRGVGDGTFNSSGIAQGVVPVDGQVRELRVFRRASGERAIAVARNGEGLMILQPR